MRRIWLLLGLCACEPSRPPVVYARYQPSVASESWCRVGDGAYAFVPRPQTAPSLVGYGCTAPRRDPLPEMARPGSTFAELVVEPGASIEIPVQLPKALQGVGCQIDSVLIPHGKRSSDMAIEIAGAGRVVPIVSYEQLPPPEDGRLPRTVSDGSGQRKAIWAPDAPAGESSLAVIADPELWPTGAVLKLDGGRTADGAASVVFEIEKAPEPPPAEEPAKTEEPAVEALPPAASGSLLPLPAGGWSSPTPSAPTPSAPTSPTPSEPTSPPASDTQDAPPPPEGREETAPATKPLPQPAPLVLVAYRHRIDIAAPDSFSIVLRAREKPFGIGVRSDRESTDPRLSHRAPGGGELTPTHLVPQVSVVVSRCGRPVDEILRDIR